MTHERWQHIKDIFQSAIELGAEERLKFLDSACADDRLLREEVDSLIAAHAVGLGTCWIGAPIPWLSSPTIAEELGIPAGYSASAAVLVGYPDEQPHGEPRPEPEVLWR